MIERSDRTGDDDSESMPRSESRADPAYIDVVAKYALLAELVCAVIFCVVADVYRGEKLPVVSLLPLAVLVLGVVASIAALLAGLVLRQVRWLLVPLAAAVVLVAFLWYAMWCCMRLGE